MAQILAILKESFWSAAASRLLYLELIVVVLFLVLLLPLGASERVNYRVGRSDVERAQVMAKQWANSESGNNPAMQLLWSELSDSGKKEVQEIADQEPGNSNIEAEKLQRGARRKMADVLNELIANSSFQDDPLWQDRLDAGGEAHLLWDRKDSLAEDNQKRLRRLLIQQTFRGQILPPADSMLLLQYAWYEFNTSVFTRITLEQLVRQWAPYVLDKIFLTVGVLLAILVTASLIPQLLEEGSLYLLLSKPLTRATLLLTKYIGSGVLILCISTLLLTGIWLILGWRFGIWMQEILWMIPMALAIYLVYFSVTVTAGLLFRNTIISIIMTLSFALLCYTLSMTHWVFEQVLVMDRRSEVMEVDDQIIGTDTGGRQFLYQSDGSWRWVFFTPNNDSGEDIPDEVLDTIGGFMPMPVLASPGFDAQRKLLLGEIAVVPPKNRGGGLATYFAAARSDNATEIRKPQRLGQVPLGCVGFAFDKDGHVLAVTKHGAVWGLTDDSEQWLDDLAAGTWTPATPAADLAEAADVAEVAEVEVAAQPREVEWELLGAISESGPDSSERFAYDPRLDCFWTIGRLGISKAERHDSGLFQITSSFKSTWDWSKTNRTPIVKVANRLLVPQRSGPVVVLNSDSLEVVAEFQLPFSNVPVSATSNDRFGVLAYRDDGAWYFDAKTDELKKITAVDDLVLAADMRQDNQVLLVQDIDRLTTVDLADDKVVESRQPSRSTIRLFVELGLNPLYEVLPKPNECYALVEYLATEGMDDAGARGDGPEEIQMDRDARSVETTSPWNPLLSSLAFAVVLMGFNCLFFARQQF